MIDGAKRTWREFRRSRPGNRFRERYDRRREATSGPLDPRNLLYLGGGVAIIVVGTLLAPIPGPGGFVAFVGLALLGSLFLPVARLLDWSELRARHIAGRAEAVWLVLPPAARVVIALLAVITIVAAGYGAYRVAMSL